MNGFHRTLQVVQWLLATQTHDEHDVHDLTYTGYIYMTSSVSVLVVI